LHKHHIIPKYLGGSNDPSNIILLTVEEHANAHKELWEKYGNWRDKLAWMGLAKIIPKEEHIRLLAIYSGREGPKKRKGTNKGKKYKQKYRNHGPTTGTKWYHNPLNHLEKRCLKEGSQPEGWVKGQGKKLINPGLNFTKNRLTKST
jgi:hypothetical protein